MRKSWIALALALLLCGCGGKTKEPVETIDPYEGMVQVESGYGTKMWVTEYEDVPVNLLTAADFTDGEYTGHGYNARRGIDVSEHQGRINWAAVAESGEVDFAILRAGYRGYGEAGTMRRDLYFQDNMNGVMECGLDVGVYFFSQATSVEEAEEEAEFLLSILDAYPDGTFTLPVYFDWEDIGIEAARTDGMRGDIITDCAEAFCNVIRAAGYRAGIYAYRNLGYFEYDLSRLRDCTLWIGAIGEYPDFYYAHELWQYSASGSVPGIDGAVDLDFWFEQTAPEIAE